MLTTAAMRITPLTFIALACGLALAAQGASTAPAPVGSVSSAKSFKVSGATAKVEGIPSWPVFIGDLIEAGLAPAVIMLKGRETFTLQPGSRAAVQGGDEGLTLRLLGGSMEYLLPSASKAQVFAGTQAVTQASGQVSLGETGVSTYVPPRARGPITNNPPAGLRPRSPNSPCAADKTAAPPRSPC